MQADILLNHSFYSPHYLEYFVISKVTSQPIIPLEDDFTSSVSSRCRSGEFGCWMDPRRTRVEVVGSQNLLGLPGSKAWWDLRKSLLLRADVDNVLMRPMLRH